MSNQLLVVLMLTLVLVAAGIWLLQWARLREQRQAVNQSLEARLRGEIAPAAGALPAPEPARESRRTHAISAHMKRWPGAEMLLRAGWPVEVRTYVLLALPAPVLALLAALFSQWWVGLVVLPAAALLTAAVVALRISKQRRTMVHDIPTFLDNVVRMLNLGHSMQSAFQLTPVDANSPLARPMEHAKRLQSGGLETDLAFQLVGDLYKVAELQLLASILRLAMRFGGRSDLVIERVSVFIRDREQAQAELMAQSSEARLSAWVLSVLPLGIAAYISFANPNLLLGMWNDAQGQNLLIGAGVMQLIGGAILYRMAKSLEG